MKKRNRYLDDMDDFSYRIFEEFGFKVRPPASVVAEVVRNSQDIDVFRRDMKIVYDEDTELSYS